MVFNGEVGNVSVVTTENGTLPSGHWAERATERIVSVGDDAPPAIAEQARVFKGQVYRTVDFYIKEAIKEDRSRVITLLRSAGHNDLANSVEKL
tara:strand:- start:303 stop:584 length:282 start_codon:yes stop_codon:yes gene_type:complete